MSYSPWYYLAFGLMGWSSFCLINRLTWHGASHRTCVVWTVEIHSINPSSLLKVFVSMFPSYSSRGQAHLYHIALACLSCRASKKKMAACEIAFVFKCLLLCIFVDCLLKGKCLGTISEMHRHSPTVFSNRSHCCQLAIDKYLEN